MESTSLPGLVARYAEAALPAPVHSTPRVWVTQVGEMRLKPGGRPLRFEAVEEFATDRVAFAWRARFPILGPVALHVTDAYQPPNGCLEVRLLGVPVQRRRGPDVTRGEVFRYLAELPWAPQAILANPQLEWRQLDDQTAEVSTAVADQRIGVRFVFRGNEIVQTLAERPRLEAGGAATPWIGEYRDYTVFDGIRVPARGEVRWDLPDGPFTYWRGTITSLDASGRDVR